MSNCDAKLSIQHKQSEKHIKTKYPLIMCFKYRKVLKVDEFCTLFWPLTFLSHDKT